MSANLPLAALALLSALLAGCASEEPGSVEPQAAESAAIEEDVPAPDSVSSTAADLARLAVPLEAGSGFPHGPHGGVACAQCHATVVGHQSHDMVDCESCHRGPEWLGARVIYSREECLACHHDPARGYECSRCHGTGPEPVVRTESLAFSVWDAPRERLLPFDHALHASRECSDCHSGGGGQPYTQTCASCHDNHHRPDANCSTCHQEPPADEHPLTVHQGCSGSGCHSDPVTEAVQAARNTCLVCHADRVDHEPGNQCATCHLFSPARGSGSFEGGAS
ncbi:MAG: hypothetical protein R3E10_00105 [Gemmatimonadota bacterium]